MNELNIYAISGLFYEYYDLNYKNLKRPFDLSVEGGTLFDNINSIFWSEVFSENVYSNMIDALRNDFSSLIKKDLDNLKFKAVLSNPDLFKRNIENALYYSSFHDLNVREFYSHLESLSIYCQLYSEYISYPHRLTLEDGFVVNEVSSDKMLDIIFNCTKNPYYVFIKKYYEKFLKDNNSEIIWFHGKIRLSTLTIAAMAKMYHPDVHICVVDHSSEYYSLNKIVQYLKQNSRLFTVIDSIILNDDKQTMSALRECISKGTDISNVNNLLYYDKNINEIRQTSYKNSFLTTADWTRRRENDLSEDKCVAAYNLINMRLWPNSICFWNKCTFCGINKKYINTGENVFDQIYDKIKIISNLKENGGDFYWFIDEAVPPDTIREFAEGLIENGLNIVWQIRSRIDYSYEDLDFKLLYKSGLREIRLGLESANIRIRKLMKKFSKDIGNEYIKTLVRKFNDAGISVHFPIIIGFPTETVAERQETYEFLCDLKKECPLLTFNVNILGLDVSSELFKEPYKYGISDIRWQCDSRSYIGNLVAFSMFDNSFNYNQLDEEREKFMREILYPWMPCNSIIPVSIFYRLSETSRNTLIWKYNKEPIIEEIEPEAIIKIDDYTTKVDSGPSSAIYYNLRTHHQIYCDHETYYMMNFLSKKSMSSIEIIDTMLTNARTGKYDWTDYWNELKILFELGIIVEVKDE